MGSFSLDERVRSLRHRGLISTVERSPSREVKSGGPFCLT